MTTSVETVTDRTATRLRSGSYDGLVAEIEVHFDEYGEERLWRDVPVLRTDGERITEHAVCTGIRDQATIARQAAEAPMVRW